MFKKMGCSDDEILAIKEGYKVIFKRLGIFFLFAIPLVFLILVSIYFGFYAILFSAIVGGFALFLIFAIITAFAQDIGERKLYSKEVTFKNSDGSNGSYIVIDKPKKNTL